MDLTSVVVPKPWGYEYLVYHNEDIGIWFLHLNEDARTSLHCHPSKKTGLIILKGCATVSFLSNDVYMPEYSKIMIREGVFHSTHVLSQGGLDMIEIETPNNKTDLVRMKDTYGREHQPYEAESSWLPRNGTELTLDNSAPTKQMLGYTFWVASPSICSLALADDEEVFVVLSKVGIQTKEGIPISKCGDVIKMNVVRRLLESFELAPQACALLIERRGTD